MTFLSFITHEFINIFFFVATHGFINAHAHGRVSCLVTMGSALESLRPVSAKLLQVCNLRFDLVVHISDLVTDFVRPQLGQLPNGHGLVILNSSWREKSPTWLGS